VDPNRLTFYCKGLFLVTLRREEKLLSSSRLKNIIKVKLSPQHYFTRIMVKKSLVKVFLVAAPNAWARPGPMLRKRRSRISFLKKGA